MPRSNKINKKTHKFTSEDFRTFLFLIQNHILDMTARDYLNCTYLADSWILMQRLKDTFEAWGMKGSPRRKQFCSRQQKWRPTSGTVLRLMSVKQAICVGSLLFALTRPCRQMVKACRCEQPEASSCNCTALRLSAGSEDCRGENRL